MKVAVIFACVMYLLLMCKYWYVHAPVSRHDYREWCMKKGFWFSMLIDGITGGVILLLITCLISLF